MNFMFRLNCAISLHTEMRMTLIGFEAQTYPLESTFV
ncbi:hypothetical protein V6Z11_A11G227000 [Gossypium hirsutum]